MSSKKFKKTNVKTNKQQETKKKTPATVWVARAVIILLCIAVAVTLIPSVFF